MMECGKLTTASPKRVFEIKISPTQEQIDRMDKTMKWAETLFDPENKIKFGGPRYRRGGPFQQLQEVFIECSFEGWDGEKARPISEEVRQMAIALLESLPLGIEAPEVGAEPDGHITLEWYRSPRRILSVSVGPERELHYAALFGASKRYGSEPFFGETPETIMDLIKKYG
jgi:hypothetical protein